MKIKQAVGATHQGGREHNEDALLKLSKVPLFAVADGMGGPGAGEVAANIALEVLKRHATELKKFNDAVKKDRTTRNRLALSTRVDEIFNEASREIGSEAARLGVPGMASTMLMCTIIGNFAYIAHVGDSRAYLIREGGLMRLTEDHSVAEFRYRRGKITREEYDDSPDRQVLYQALGAGEVDVDVAEVRLTDGDVLLLCTDGLIRSVADATLLATLDDDLAESVKAMIRESVDNQTPDNVTAILLGFKTGDQDAGIKQVTDVMGQVFLFSSLNEQHRLVIAPYLEEVTYEAGAVIIEEGQPADNFYVVLSGEVNISTQGTPLITIGTGGHFGELSLARPVKRSATATALKPTRVLQLSRERFHDLTKNKPELGAQLALALLDTVGDRLRDLSERLHDVERAVRGDFRLLKNPRATNQP